MTFPEVCGRCGTTERDVHRAVELGAWLCLGCFLRSPGGFYLPDDEPPVSDGLNDLLDALGPRLG
jgi:ribosomal protein L37AE/L43A